MWYIVARVIVQAFAIALINCAAQELRDTARKTFKDWEDDDNA